MWLMDGKQVEHDGSQFDISDIDGSLTLLDVSQIGSNLIKSVFQCCVELTSGPQVCGERYMLESLGKMHVTDLIISIPFNPLLFCAFSLEEQPDPPSVTLVSMTTIVLTWNISKSCSGSKVNIFWQSNRGGGQAMNVSGNRFTITGLTSGVTYNITLVIIGDGIQNDSISITATTRSKCLPCMYSHSVCNLFYSF